MSSWLRRLFHPSYRRALSAEAAGDYVAAAEAYALAGMPEKVAEMHLVRAGRTELTRRVDALDDALRWLSRSEPERVGASLRPDLAGALVLEVRDLPRGDPRRARLAAAAARLHEEDGRLKEAGEAFELAGAAAEAARCYEAAGAIEDMERLLEADHGAASASRRAREGFDDFEAALASGRRAEALSALRRCVASEPGGGYEKMLADLEARLPRPGRVEVRLDERRIVVVGKSPAVLGRGEADVPLRHAGVSRRHAAVDLDEDGFSLRDAGSRNGTTLAGLAVSGRVRLAGSGTIGLGAECALEFSARDGALDLEVREGPDRGLRVVVARGPVRPEPRAPFLLSFREGLAEVAGPEGGVLVLNGARVPGAVVVLVGDVLEAPAGGRLEVTG